MSFSDGQPNKIHLTILMNKNTEMENSTDSPLPKYSHRLDDGSIITLPPGKIKIIEEANERLKKVKNLQEYLARPAQKRTS